MIIEEKGVGEIRKEDNIILCEGGIYPLLHFTKREYKTILLSLCMCMDSPYAIELQLVGDATISGYNRRFHNVFAPTNILSFEAEENNNTSIIILSLETAYRESILYGQEYSEYIVHLLCHGFVHSMGFDHGNEMDEYCEVCYQYVYSFF